MSSSRKLKRCSKLALLETFPDGSALPESQRDEYQHKLDALKMYCKGTPHREIKRRTGVNADKVRYYLERVDEIGANGCPLGHLALQPYSQKARTYAADLLNKGKSSTGALRALFAEYPKFEKAMRKLACEGIIPDSEAKIPRQAMKPILLKECFWNYAEKLGIKAPVFPFVGGTNGGPGFLVWVSKVRLEHDSQEIAGRNARMKKDPWLPPREEAGDFYTVVECDGHWMDVAWWLEVKSLRGEGVLGFEVHRIWLIAIVEIRSSAILGYSIAFGSNYNSGDVLRAVRCAMVPWKPLDLTTTRVAYKEGDGLPNGVAPELAFVCWDELHVDGAAASASDLHLSSLEATVACETVIGPIGQPNARPNVEGTFHLLRDAVALLLKEPVAEQRSTPSSKRKKGGRRIFSFTQLKEFIDVVVAGYNGSTAPGTSMSRNELLVHVSRRTSIVLRRMPTELRARCEKHDVFDVATVSIDKGRAQVWWQEARYSNDALQSRLDLDGKQVVLATSSQDSRKLDVWLSEDGSSLGSLEIEPRYRSSPSSAGIRAHARRAAKDGGLAARSADMVLGFRVDLETAAKKGQSAKQKLARMIHEQEVAAAKKASAEQPANAPPPQGDPAKEPEAASKPLKLARAAPLLLVHPDDLAAIKKLGSSY